MTDHLVVPVDAEPFRRPGGLTDDALGRLLRSTTCIPRRADRPATRSGGPADDPSDGRHVPEQHRPRGHCRSAAYYLD
ncbi:hypothetical protein [Kitasatospora sp. NPDC051914]|uniref:hypothetical protein n=1 Tax=Kitasatospora sp. NPDC051914 TaxID=3154945 RepID=UPI00343ACBE0